MQLQNYIDDVQELVHDVSQSSWLLPRVISRINEARLDVSRDCHCVRQNVTGIQLLPGQEIYNLAGSPGSSGVLYGGAVAGATVTAGGAGYGGGSTVPITFTAAPAGGVTATGIGNLTAGSLASITMTQWGQGYTAAPVITVGGTGAAAAASPVTLFNVLAVCGISYIWNGERRSLKYLEFPLFQAYARMWVQNFNAPPGVFNHLRQANPGQIYIQPPPDQLYLAEWDVIRLASPLINVGDNDADLVDPWSRAVQFRAAELLLMKHRNWGDVGFYAQHYESFIPHIIATSGSVRIPNPYNRNFQRRVMR
jgi:hypothetical protein